MDLSRTMFPTAPPSLMRKARILQFAVNIQKTKGEFRDDEDGFVHIPQLLPAPNTVNEGAGLNIIPEGDTPVNAPGGAAIPPAPNISTGTYWHTCQYPPAKWICGADGKLECINLSELKQQNAMGKLNQDIFTLTFGKRQIPPYAQTMSKSKKKLKYKQYQRSLQSSGDWALQLMSIEDSLHFISPYQQTFIQVYYLLQQMIAGMMGLQRS
jgi:hypothetical protein